MTRSRNTLFYIIVIFFTIPLAANSIAGNIAMDKEKVAIYGYDPTAYFTQHKPVKGVKDFSLDWNGAKWYFTSQNALELFKANPKKYAPQYGGFCANGLSDGHKIEANPENWRIIDGKLYLYFSDYGRQQWSGGIKQLIENANETWDNY